MKKRSLTVLLAALLIVSLLLQGCTATVMKTVDDAPSATVLPAERSTAPTEPATAEPATLPEHVDYHDFDRPRDEDALAEIPFSEIVYERSDTEAICAEFAALQKLVEDNAEFDEVLAANRAVCLKYAMFNTMSTYAYIRYSIDLNDTYFESENDWSDRNSPLVEQAKEKCFTAMANSPLRAQLEAEYFDEGFFDFYDRFQVYSNDRVVELMQQEAELEADYMSLQSDQTIAWNGEEVLFSEMIETLPYTEMLAAYRLYFDKYGAESASILAQLIRLRREMAAELGYDSYADFAYAYYYQRDYTPAQTKQYVTDIAEELTPYFYAAMNASYKEPMDTDTTMAMLKAVAYAFGGEFCAAYDYMIDYNLYDISESSSKMPGSFMTYLSAYEMPYLYVSPEKDIGDLMTAAHEFGHFVDGYVNCNGTSSIDCAEIFSQGLEFLTLNRADLTAQEREALTVSQLGGSVTVFLSQACYAEFERRIYELSDEELTQENFDRIFNDCNEEFGMGMPGLEDIIGPGWIGINHFFVAPYYVISYCVSADVALQIFEREQEHGDGLVLYRELMGLSSDNTILNLLSQTDMRSPFDEGRIAEIADLFDDYLD